MTPLSAEVTITAPWIRDRLLAAIAATVAGTLVLTGVLALGWNSPRPGGPADWEAPTLPRVVTAVPNEVALMLLDYRSSDFTIEALALPLADPDSGLHEYGLVYRAQDTSHYYAFALGTDGYYAVFKVDGGVATPMVAWQQFPHVRRGQQPNRLTVACEGPSCSFRVNDEYAAAVEDDQWLSGGVGLWARGFQGEGVVEFRRVRVWLPDG